MGIDAVQVGGNSRQILVIGDPVTASNQASVLAIGDATSLSGLFGQIGGAVGLVKNAAGTFDIVRAAPGITGIPSVSVEGTKATYSCGSIAVVPAATATDIWTIFGSGTKTIRLVRLEIYGTATAAASIDLQLIKRTTANTGGTATQPTAVPHDSNNVAATAAVNLYSANPGLGTALGALRGGRLNLGAAGAGGSLMWNFGDRNSQQFVLRTAAQGLCLNWNGAAVPSGTDLCISAEWVEDAS